MWNIYYNYHFKMFQFCMSYVHCVLQTILHIVNAEYGMLLLLANFTLQHKVKSSLQTFYGPYKKKL